MTNVPYPVLYVPTAADRAAACKVFLDNGLYWAVDSRTLPSKAWEAAHGHTCHYVRYSRGTYNDRKGGFWFDDRKLDSNILTNSPQHLIRYLKRHGLPLSV